MATNQTQVMTSHNLLNYSGMLFNKGYTQTPFSTLIGGKSRTAQNWEFVTSLSYTTGGGTSSDNVSGVTETASLTAPNPTFVTRAQATNYCQIFVGALSISYAKQSSMSQLSGLNIAGQAANPANELDFQAANKMIEIRKNIEYAFINGTKANGTHDDVAYKTQGILGAVDSGNVNTLGTAEPLSYWLVAELIKKVYDANGDTSNLVLMCDPVHIMQLNADAVANGLTVIPAGREINGIKLTTLVTPFGTVGFVANPFIPKGTALLFNPSVCAPVYMPVPGKGNFFLEPLAKTGAADKYQIYGQAGLDYGIGTYHAKITGLTQTFTAPTYTNKVFVTNAADFPGA